MTAAPALWNKHRPLALLLARDYRFPGMDRDDVEQEALIGLWVASRDYRPDRGTVFPTFARLVIRRRLDALVRMALAGKHGPLNDSVRVVTDETGEWVHVTDTLPGGRDPLDVAITRETLDRLVAAVSELTPLERVALAHVVNADYGDGYSKQTDNAAHRARRKLRAAA